MTPLYEILIRRDAHTITPVTVPDYEVPLIQELFGTENVQNADKVRADEAGIGSPIGSFKASDDEYERFCVKYGVELVEIPRPANGPIITVRTPSTRDSRA